jgi:hypothetical protein
MAVYTHTCCVFEHGSSWTLARRALARGVAVQHTALAGVIHACRLGTYSANAATVPPAAIVAAKAMAADPRAEPRYGERVPYLVVYGEPGEAISAVGQVDSAHGMAQDAKPAVADLIPTQLPAFCLYIRHG